MRCALKFFSIFGNTGIAAVRAQRPSPSRVKVALGRQPFSNSCVTATDIPLSVNSDAKVFGSLVPGSTRKTCAGGETPTASAASLASAVIHNGACVPASTERLDDARATHKEDWDQCAENRQTDAARE